VAGTEANDGENQTREHRDEFTLRGAVLLDDFEIPLHSLAPEDE
jgi:hypothetical protein